MNDILNGKIQLDEVEKALSRIRKGKASGIDGTPIELYSSDIKYFTSLLTTLFNAMFDSADYPDDSILWSYVIPWESRVNSCHLRFSCSEFYADSKKIGCHFLSHLKVIFRPLEVITPRSHLFIYLL